VRAWGKPWLSTLASTGVRHACSRHVTAAWSCSQIAFRNSFSEFT